MLEHMQIHLVDLKIQLKTGVFLHDWFESSK